MSFSVGITILPCDSGLRSRTRSHDDVILQLWTAAFGLLALPECKGNLRPSLFDLHMFHDLCSS